MLTRSLSKLRLHSPTSTTRLVSMETESSSGLSLDSLPNCLLLIPDEVLSHIISFLSLADIGMLCLTGSSSLRDRVVVWITTTSCAKKVILGLTKEMKDRQTGYDEWIISCKQFGVLCKRASMLCSTSTRLRLLKSWYYKLEVLVCDKMDRDWAKLWGRLGLAASTSTFTLGWDETEFCRVMGWVKEMEGEKMSVVRMFFWDFVDHEDTKASWLSFIVSTFVKKTSSKETVEHQAAQLLFLMLGPADDDLSLLPTSYRDLNFFQQNLLNRVEGNPSLMTMREQVPATYSEAKEMFSD